MHKLAAIFSISFTSAYGSILKYDFIEISPSIELLKLKPVGAGEYDSMDTVGFKSTDGLILKIRKADLKSKTDKEKLNFFNKNIAQYTLLFQDRVSPYTGGVTVNTECVDKDVIRHEVVTTNQAVMTSFETMATANLVYGKCDGDKSGYHSKYFLTLCKGKGIFYDVRFFSRKKNDLKSLQVKCVQ